MSRPETMDARRPGRVRLVLLLAGLLLGLFLSELDQTVFATTLPTIVDELGQVDRMSWMVTANVVAATIVMPVVGKLGDLYGRRPVYLTALCVLVAGSVVGGLAPDLGWLVVARVLQGLGGGGIFILVQATVADVVPPRERARVLSLVGAVFAGSAVVGPVLGGWLAEGIGWRWSFWIYVPLGALALVAALLFLPPAAGGPGRRAAPVDVAGMTTLGIAVTALVLATTWGGAAYAWTSAPVLGLLTVAVGAGVTFVLAERRAAEPLIPMSLFADRTFTLATFAGLVLATAMFGSVAYLPTYLQRVTGLTPTGAGLLLLTLIGGLGLATVVSAQSVARNGRYRRWPVLGAALVAGSLAFLALLPAGSPVAVLAVGLFLLGAGIGCGLQILVVIVQNTVEPGVTGTATAAHSFFREVGVCIGAAAVGALFTTRLAALLPTDVDQATAYQVAFTPVLWLLAPLALLSGVALLFLPHVPLATTLEQSALEQPAFEEDPQEPAHVLR